MDKSIELLELIAYRLENIGKTLFEINVKSNELWKLKDISDKIDSIKGTGGYDLTDLNSRFQLNETLDAMDARPQYVSIVFILTTS